MRSEEAIRAAVQRVGRIVRVRRAALYGLRGLAWGLTTGLIPLLGKAGLGPAALPAALALAAVGGMAGIVYGLLLPVPLREPARLVDRTFRLDDRLATAVEHLGQVPRGPLVEALIEDAADRVRDRDLGATVPWRWPREVRILPASALALWVLVLLPPVRFPEGVFPSLTPSGEQEAERQAQSVPVAQDRRLARARETAPRVEVQERDYLRRRGTGRETQQGDLSAIFRDTNIAQRRPDFSSFLKHGDDRLKILGQVESLPDLQRDFTQSQFRVAFRRAKRLLAGIRPDQVSPEKLRELLDEMRRLGRRGGGEEWGQDVWEGSEALADGRMQRALEAMERALSRMRAMEERSGKGLEGGRDRGRGQGRNPGMRGGEGEDFGEYEGSLPGKGTNPDWRGAPSTRLAQDPLDSAVEGQPRRGRRDAFDTNLLGKGSRNPSHLPYMSVYAQYRKMMEEALTKETIPLDYRTQVKEYFRALEER
ncbi:MAG: hypothetical protein HYV61_11305 [Candidatus Rokubacteria bacterium]|nr:hypothetical protein [Candidatus Rokubacteria bacterium]